MKKLALIVVLIVSMLSCKQNEKVEPDNELQKFTFSKIDFDIVSENIGGRVTNVDIPIGQTDITFIRKVNHQDTPGYDYFYNILQTFDPIAGPMVLEYDPNYHGDGSILPTIWDNYIVAWTNIDEYWGRFDGVVARFSQDPNYWPLRYKNHIYYDYIDLIPNQYEYDLSLKLITGEMKFTIDASNFEDFPVDKRPNKVTINFVYDTDYSSHRDFIYERIGSDYSRYGHTETYEIMIDSVYEETTGYLMPFILLQSSDIIITYYLDDVILVTYKINVGLPENENIMNMFKVERAMRTIVKLPKYVGDGFTSVINLTGDSFETVIFEEIVVDLNDATIN